jgi:hypothetical protein
VCTFLSEKDGGEKRNKKKDTEAEAQKQLMNGAREAQQ